MFPTLEELTPTPDDEDPSSLLFRIGYLLGMATRLEGVDRDFVLKAVRSLKAYAVRLGASDIPWNCPEPDCKLHKGHECKHCDGKVEW